MSDERFEITGFGFTDLRESSASLFAGPSGIGLMLVGFQDDYGPNLERCTVVGHNLYFDLLILREKYGNTPKYTVDTRDLSRHLDARDFHDLAHLAKKYKCPILKGDTDQFKGLHVSDMTEQQRADLNKYCCGDIDITAFLLKKFKRCRCSWCPA